MVIVFPLFFLELWIQALQQQAENIKLEIARKEEERKRMRLDQRSETGISISSKPGSVLAFPVEPDPVCANQFSTSL